MAARFANDDPEHRPHDLRAVLRCFVWDRLTGRSVRRPAGPPAPRLDGARRSPLEPEVPARVAWIGHASFLLSLGDRHVLIDPVFSERVGGLVRRHAPPGWTPGELPRLHATLITHAHYDHLDRKSVLALPPDTVVVVPRGLGPLMRRWGRVAVVELRWWESTEIDSVKVTFVPARHWSRRWGVPTNAALWGGYVIERDGRRIYHAGDSGAFPGFAEIRRRFPDLAVAMLPIGAYDPAWFMERHHLNPEQAGEAFLALGARTLVPMHWGVFQLTNEPLCEPIERLERWWERRRPEGKRLLRLAVGEAAQPG